MICWFHFLSTMPLTYFLYSNQFVSIWNMHSHAKFPSVLKHLFCVNITPRNMCLVYMDIETNSSSIFIYFTLVLLKWAAFMIFKCSRNHRENDNFLHANSFVFDVFSGWCCQAFGGYLWILSAYFIIAKRMTSHESQEPCVIQIIIPRLRCFGKYKNEIIIYHVHLQWDTLSEPETGGGGEFSVNVSVNVFARRDRCSLQNMRGHCSLFFLELAAIQPSLSYLYICIALNCLPTSKFYSLSR